MSPATVLASLPEFSSYLTNTLGRSEHTAKAYVSDARSFARFLLNVTGTETALAAAFVTWLKQSERNSPSTVKRKVAALTAYFAWQPPIGLLATNPFDSASVEIRLPRRLPRAVARQDILRLLKTSAPTKHDHASQATDLATRLLVATGLRISELCSINLEDVSPDGSSIRIRGKGNRERTVFLSNVELQGRLAEACRIRGSATTEPLFVSRRRLRLSPQAYRLRLHRLRASSGLTSRITPHCLRHTAATLLIEAGVDIRFVQRLLGHASISTTEIYTHVVDESLRNALLKADPMRGM